MAETTPIKVARSGKVIGEFPREAIQGKLLDGSLLPTDHYWKNGMTSWTLLGDSGDWVTVAPKLSIGEPPPVPASAGLPPEIPRAMPFSQPSNRTLKGRVLGYTFQSSSGYISSTSDGMRYGFNAADWLSSDQTPTPGMEVEFLAHGTQAKSIFVTSKAPAAGASANASTSYYRSSDDAFVSGVCAGLAHKWKTDTILIRILMLFVPIGLILYIIASISWEARPTKGV